jgi:hypothetical protein
MGVIFGRNEITAATAVSLDFTVITSNARDFENIEALSVEKRVTQTTRAWMAGPVWPDNMFCDNLIMR